MLVKRELIVLALQASFGVAATPDPATDSIEVQQMQLNPVSQRMVDRPVIKPTLGKRPSLYAGHLMQLTATAEVKGSGVKGTAPEIGKALQACGLAETVVASTSVTYAPASVNVKMATIDVYQDGNKTRLINCRGTATVTLKAGDVAKVAFTFTGHQDGARTAAAFPSASFIDTVPTPLIGLSNLSVGGFDADLDQWTLDLGNEVTTPGSIRTANGYGEVRITDRDPNGTIDPEDVLVTTKDWQAEWMSGTQSTIDSGVVGNTAGNQFQLVVSKAAWRDVQQGEREQVRTAQLQYGAAETSGDDQFSWVFT